MTKQTSNPPLTTEEQKGMIMEILCDMADGGADKLLEYLSHVGFDLNALSDPKDLPDAWLGFYRLGQGSYDVDRATMDLLTWPPIARAVFEGLQAQGKQ